MFRLLMIFFSLISTTLMGVGVIIALTSGYDSLNHIIVFALAGLVVSIPTSMFITHGVVRQ